ncbi:aspartate/glutamate racemase family protein [Allopusillimonas ginsengisoli]|uniref:aspartate/glutamate racemase family protein n=1 Tax=Allopusillimonas ginsengisoli TaxID=453575 RepID=UPI001021CEB2|nr:aspartate/glutamate racemase family protein [Allopusillimonas ginsengisoli]TEA78001.1 aspartate/glutamate racemase family protein [Allopusillimonas ginsengisoli]
MKTIGLLGGMSWESTADYYREINQGVARALGGLHSAELVMYSVDFEPIEKLQHQGDWEGAGRILTDAARRVQAAGADFLVLCTNTMHKLADDITGSVDIPLLHIADATAKELTSHGVGTVGLLGTAFTMEQDFYRGRLETQFGLTVIVPDVADRKIVHDIIYRELCLGSVEAGSRAEYLRIISGLAAQGAQAVILGCTEIGLLVSQKDTDVPLFDTTRIHARHAVSMALGR